MKFSEFYLKEDFKVGEKHEIIPNKSNGDFDKGTIEILDKKSTLDGPWKGKAGPFYKIKHLGGSEDTYVDWVHQSELPKMKKIIESLVVEAKDVFSDVDVIKIDPDRADPYDIVSAVMPTLVRAAYVLLVEDQIKYKRNKDEDDPEFEFTEEALSERLDELIKQVCRRFDDQSRHDLNAYITRLKGEFKVKLEEEK
jgi:hypothetical protein